jgi:hypothetical protein
MGSSWISRIIFKINPMKDITRKQKTLMFLNEYYFGYHISINILRLLGGPLIIGIGIYFFEMKDADNMATTYAALCFLYGIYYMLKPYLWVLGRWKAFGDNQIRVDIDGEMMSIAEDKARTEVRFDHFSQIIERSWYFTFLINRNQRISLPKSVLTEEQMVQIRQVRPQSR